jgi:hypothetical protein
MRHVETTAIPHLLTSMYVSEIELNVLLALCITEVEETLNPRF